MRYTVDEIKELIARDGDKTDYDRVDGDAEIMRQIANDPDLQAIPLAEATGTRLRISFERSGDSAPAGR